MFSEYRYSKDIPTILVVGIPVFSCSSVSPPVDNPRQPLSLHVAQMIRVFVAMCLCSSGSSLHVRLLGIIVLLLYLLTHYVNRLKESGS